MKFFIRTTLVIAITLLVITLSACDSSKPQATPPELPENSGKVVKAMHAGGYTYMLVEKDNKQIWIAAGMMNVKREQIITWEGGSLMKDFKSSSLRRTFDEIVFVTSAAVYQPDKK